MKLSIITTTYNSKLFIAKTIKSVLSQTYKDFEYIIIDDRSSDSTIDEINQFSDKRIKFIKNEKNLGIVGSRNKALKLAKGKYICFIDHDDIWKNKKKIEKQINFLEKNSSIGIVGSYVEFIDIDDNTIGKFEYESEDIKIRNKILIYNQFCTCSVMFRKNLLNKTGLLKQKYEKVDDYDLWLRIGKVSKFSNIPEYLVQYRKMKSNTSTKNFNFFKMKITNLKLIIENFKYYPNGKKAIIINIINIFIPYRFAEYLRPKMKKIF